MLFGAMAAAAASKPFAATPGRRLKSLLAAAIGGLLMGWGARLGFGCNIGAFVGGVASGSLHGWVWFCRGAARLPDRHPPAAAVRPVAGVGRCETSIFVVVLLGLAAIVGNHLISPSSGRAVSPEDFAGACAPCGAPCPSKK